MPGLGVYLIFAAVVLRTAVVVSSEPEFPIVMALLAGYGLLLFGKTWLLRRAGSAQPLKAQLTYLLLQSILVIGSLIIASYEDFLAMLFVPLSLDAVLFFGRRYGFITVAILCLAMVFTLLFSDVGPVFGLVMGVLYSGVCFLVGGYAAQIQRASTAHERNEQILCELQTAYRQLQGYADQKASLAIEQERSRLARELHDSVTQTVFSMNLAAQSAHLLLEKDSSRTTGQLLRIEELAASALKEIQSLVSQLKPRSIRQESLPSALRRLAAEQNARNGLHVLLEIHDDGTLSEEIATRLYSITHEALVNAGKHSGTCDVTVRLNLGKENSSLVIEDHGRGFDPDAIWDQRGHLGLASMFEQAREIGWTLAVISKPGQGTRILVTEKPAGLQP